MAHETLANTDKTSLKKPYTTPLLVEYGDIAKLTQGNPSGAFADGMSGMMMTTACL
jgi:hypothetical protein